jgi:hypothetical protein
VTLLPGNYEVELSFTFTSAQQVKIEKSEREEKSKIGFGIAKIIKDFFSPN